MEPVIPTRIAPSPKPEPLEPAQVRREFRERMGAGARLRPAGEARHEPQRLLTRAYLPVYKLELFDVGFYLADVRQNATIRFFVAYVVIDARGPGPAGIYPRIFYKDGSLVWRSASHFIPYDGDSSTAWIGKGDVETIVSRDYESVVTLEHTTDLPLELQPALEELSRRPARIPHDDAALALVLRRAPPGRIEPYRDFSEPRRRARANPRNLVYGGRRIARFTRRHDPTSLRFAAGFEPDFRAGLIEVSESGSRLYGGRIRRFRIRSRNARVQYLFFAGPHHVWLANPQATTTQLSSYGVRTIDVAVDDDLCVPGMEYHYLEGGDPPVFVTQIPDGYAGEPSPVDAWRADASPWLERLPVVRAFRREVLARRS
jgi:hypothetical protein